MEELWRAMECATLRFFVYVYNHPVWCSVHVVQSTWKAESWSSGSGLGLITPVGAPLEFVSIVDRTKQSCYCESIIFIRMYFIKQWLIYAWLASMTETFYRKNVQVEKCFHNIIFFIIRTKMLCILGTIKYDKNIFFFINKTNMLCRLCTYVRCKHQMMLLWNKNSCSDVTRMKMGRNRINYRINICCFCFYIHINHVY